MSKKILTISIFLLLFFVCGCVQKTTTYKRILYPATIVEVIDGDTIKTNNNETIRLLHVNTPEKGEKCYQEAKNRLKELVENKTIWTERDMQDKDKYGRKLRYVFLSYNTDSNNFSDFVNLIMIREGYASLLMIEPNMRYQQVFKQAFKDASQEEGCIWSSKSRFFGCFSVEKFHYDAEGDDCKNANDEYVVLKNLCEDANLKGWTIKDSARHTYLFEEFIVKKGVLFILHSGSGNNNETNLFWNSNLECPSIWNNDHDSLFLRDSEDNLVLQFSY
ncbi:MAG: thermonuclease family protein [Candidatus Pacearchaeota archaeon]|nr:thermonuclease family protein [Candidatus Pacearchaeota archaeon]